MVAKRDLLDAVSDRQVKKPAPPPKRLSKRRNHALVKICVSLVCGFLGGYVVGRWVRIL
jgi:hypothetical protein